MPLLAVQLLPLVMEALLLVLAMEVEGVWRSCPSQTVSLVEQAALQQPTAKPQQLLAAQSEQ